MFDADGGPVEPPPPPAPLRSTLSRELMASWSLVLEALGIEGHVVHEGPVLHLFVAPADRPRAEAALAAADRERHAEVVEVPPAPDAGRSAAGLGFAIAIAAFHWVTGPRAGADPGAWFRRGSAVAEQIVAGELYRAVTALSLHADWGHVAGNAAAALIFVSALGRWMGGGTALLATLAAGTIGNLIVGFAHGSHHNSVGASTATFAALGLLGGLQVVRWTSGGDLPGSRRRSVLKIVGACLGVFAMLGVSERADVGAHIAGLGVGLALGLALGRFVRLPVRPLPDVAAGIGAIAVVAAAWLVAFAR